MRIIRKFSKGDGQKINVQKSIAFIYIDNLQQKIITKKMPLKIPKESVNSIVGKLITNTQNLYREILKL